MPTTETHDQYDLNGSPPIMTFDISQATGKLICNDGSPEVEYELDGVYRNVYVDIVEGKLWVEQEPLTSEQFESLPNRSEYNEVSFPLEFDYSNHFHFVKNFKKTGYRLNGSDEFEVGPDLTFPAVIGTDDLRYNLAAHDAEEVNVRIFDLSFEDADLRIGYDIATNSLKIAFLKDPTNLTAGPLSHKLFQSCLYRTA